MHFFFWLFVHKALYIKLSQIIFKYNKILRKHLHWDRLLSSPKILRGLSSSACKVLASMGFGNGKFSNEIEKRNHMKIEKLRRKWERKKKGPTLQIVIDVDSSACNCHFCKTCIEWYMNGERSGKEVDPNF